MCISVGLITPGAIWSSRPGSYAQSYSQEGVKNTGPRVSQSDSPCHVLAPRRPWASDFTSPRFHFLFSKVCGIIVCTSIIVCFSAAERYTHKFSGGSCSNDASLTLILYAPINISPPMYLIQNPLCIIYYVPGTVLYTYLSLTVPLLQVRSPLHREVVTCPRSYSK